MTEYGIYAFGILVERDIWDYTLGLILLEKLQREYITELTLQEIEDA